MISQHTIDEAVHLLAMSAKPTRIILFGSYARGEAGEESDVDLLVVKPQVDNRRQETVRLRKALTGLNIPVDIIVVSEEYFNKWSEAPSTAMYWAKHEGKVVYEAA